MARNGENSDMAAPIVDVGAGEKKAGAGPALRSVLQAPGNEQ